ncbi:endonuclease [Sphingomonas sp. Leaf357]|uniref:GIY-YIG nuclease family protein n=1 Tax=Sphingomonas sp. Leaf357 TaxID=1736350 RepID=UPI0007010BC0|nr:GIY-YIG nuclease family protein [Sphingomonas sp. Leaf357]KQS01357.1 endonuclease [Sphingomonas sp. Leaf357]
MREREPCVYLMVNRRLGAIYVGATSNLIGRVIQHREGTFDGFTKRHGIKRLAWYEAGETMDAVIARERAMKNWLRDWKIELIEQDNPAWNDLAVGLGLNPLP